MSETPKHTPHEDAHNCAKCGVPLIKKENCIVEEGKELLCHTCWTAKNESAHWREGYYKAQIELTALKAENERLQERADEFQRNGITVLNEKNLLSVELEKCVSVMDLAEKEITQLRSREAALTEALKNVLPYADDTLEYLDDEQGEPKRSTAQKRIESAKSLLSPDNKTEKP